MVSNSQHDYDAGYEIITKDVISKTKQKLHTRVIASKIIYVHFACDDIALSGFCDWFCYSEFFPPSPITLIKICQPLL